MRTDERTDRQTDRHDEANSRFSQFADKPRHARRSYIDIDIFDIDRNLY